MGLSLLSSVDSRHGKRQKFVVVLVNRLRGMGAQAHLDLPRIAVIGNQSAGKSSLVEALSGITVPRDAGTCTRCPMECRLSQFSGDWSCQVSIRWEFKEDGTRFDEVKEAPFGPIITSKADVELVLRRAQAAILNPGRLQSEFLRYNTDNLQEISQNHQLTFSRNAVCVDLLGPEFTELTFIDLPGIIQNADSETVEFVEDLVLSHIRGNSLILVTLPMSDDIENQKAMRLAKQVDPHGQRTIGVLTKPDTLTAGARKAKDLWLDVIEGRRHPLRHGYFCTRQPDDEERTGGITPEEARTAESAFFAKTEPWSQSSQQHRFGTKSLINSISPFLSQLIEKTLPTLQLETEKQLDDCLRRLAHLPPLPTSEPASYVLDMVTSFCRTVEKCVHGDPDSAELVQADRRIYNRFKSDIRSSAPEFLPFANKAELPPDVSLYLNDITDDRDPEDFNKQLPKYIFLQDVRKYIERSLTRELPNNVPYSAKTVLIQSSQRTWLTSSRRCFDSVYREFKSIVYQLIDNQFGRYKQLRNYVKYVATELIDAKQAKAWRHIQTILDCEHLLYTQNDHYYQVTKEKYLARYKDARAGQTVFVPPNAPASPTDSGLISPQDDLTRPTEVLKNFKGRKNDVKDEWHANLEQQALAALAAIGYHVSPVDLGKLVPPDIYEQEMDVMAEVRAYFQVAYKRVIDSIPMAIDFTFLFSVSKSLQPFLNEKLELGTANAAGRCAVYLSEDPNIVAEREELLSKKKPLESIQTELFNFGVS